MSWSDPNQGQHLSINSIIKHIQHTHTHIYHVYIYIDRHMYIYYVVHALVMLHYVIWLSIVNFRLYIVLDYDYFREVFRDAFYTVSEAAVAEKPMLCVWFLFMFCILEFQWNLVKPHHFQSQKAFVHQAGNEGQIEKSRRSGSLA